ncbi:ABC transporter permease [Ruminococcus sp.]|uniref:ABC transporter permease n=1 Tax=Ruminococcus sp. TaxID=41978 RepID=UPI003EFD747F
MKLRRYFSMTRAGMLEQLQFRLGSLVTVAGNLIYLVLIYFLWKAIFASAGTEEVNGMTFSDTLIYLVLASALFSFMEMYLVWYMGNDIQSGKIVLDLIKPIGYRKFLFWTQSGSLVMSFLMTFLPTFLVVYFLTDGVIHLGVNLLFFMVSVVFALTINFCIDFFIGTVCLYTQSIWGINIMKEVIVLLLSGATIPLAFFPDTLRRIVSYLPFQSIYNTPLTILIRNSMPLQETLTMLAVQLFWACVMLLLTSLFWRRSIRKITVNGG